MCRRPHSLLLSVRMRAGCYGVRMALQGVPGSRTRKRVLTCYSQTAEFKHWPLAWMAANIVLEEHAPWRQAWTDLGLKSPPTLATVRSYRDLLYCKPSSTDLSGKQEP